MVVRENHTFGTAVLAEEIGPVPIDVDGLAAAWTIDVGDTHKSVHLHFQFGDAVLADFQDRETDVMVVIVFAGRRDSAGEFEDQPGGGLKALVRDVHAELLLQVADLHPTTAQEGTGRESPEAVACLVTLVTEIPGYEFDEVFDGDHSGHSSILVHHDGNGEWPPTQFIQKRADGLGLRREEDFPVLNSICP